MRGWVRDELVRADGTVERSPWRPNLVVRGGLDLVAALLCEHEGARGLGWLAVGTGDGTWDATPPPRDPARRALTAEVARVALQPGTRQLSYDEDGGRVVVRATFGRGVATGTLRETGLFGGARASILAGSGVLVNHQAHGPIDKGPDDVLHRDVALVLGDDLGPGARALVGRLLARRPGTRGLTHLALGTGTDADPGPDALVEERWRGRLDRRGVRYDAATATVVVRARVDPAEVLATWPQGEPDADGRRAPLPVREVGLLGGDARDGGILVARTAVDLPPPDDPRPIEHTARLVLSARTDVVVPDLSGLALDEARAALGADLLLGEVVERVVVGVSGGTVEAQAPPPGTQVNELSTVDVQIVRPTLVAVPEVVGLPLARARAALRRHDLSVAGEPVAREVGPEGPPRDVVVACDPAPGHRVPRGSEVRVTVALPREVKVPRVLGRTPFGAEVELRRAGFGDEIAWTERVSGATRGTVVFQRPAPDTTAPLDVELELTVAVPAWVEVPEVTGLDVDEAARLVDAAGRAVMAALDRDGPPGLSVGTVTPLDDVAEVGRVVAQRPTAGERVPLHGVVELDVSVGESIPVPDLAGLDQPAALAVLGGAGLRLGRVTTRAGEEAPGTVVGQEPAPGRVLPAGLRVDIVVAAASQVRVPHLGGFDSPAAQEALAARSLDLGPIELVVGEGEPGRIVGQDPEPDSLVAVGTEVSIVVVDGVPGLVGASRDDAVRRLEDAGLTAVEGEVESTGPAGIVVSQDPVKGAAVPADRRVRIGVAVPARVEVPDLVGLLPQAAVDALARQGLAGRVQASEPGPNDPPTIAEGAVRRQQPAAGERAPRGSTVSLWLRAAQNVTVPDVVGRTPAEATKALTAAQLTPEIGAPLPSSSVPAGNIAATDPPAGTSVPKFRRVLLRPAAAMIRVPSVLGLSEGRAREVLRSVGLSDVAIEDLFAPHDPGGALVRAVVDQSPAEGAVVSPETRVRLTLGVQLRDVSGSDQRLAMRVLAQDGIEVVGTVAETSRSFAEGLVTRTDPAAGSVITPGTQVWLHVSSGSIFVDPGRLVVEPEWIIPIRREPDPEPFTRIDVGRLDLGRIVRPDS